MITISSTIAFAVGMTIVYLMFRFLGVIGLVFLLSLAQSAPAVQFQNVSTNFLTLQDTGSSMEVALSPNTVATFSVAGWSGCSYTANSGFPVSLTSAQFSAFNDTNLVTYYYNGSTFFFWTPLDESSGDRDIYPSLGMGIVFGFVCMGIGWPLRTGKTATTDY